MLFDENHQSICVCTLGCGCVRVLRFPRLRCEPRGKCQSLFRRPHRTRFAHNAPICCSLLQYCPVLHYLHLTLLLLFLLFYDSVWPRVGGIPNIPDRLCECTVIETRVTVAGISIPGQTTSKGV